MASNSKGNTFRTNGTDFGEMGSARSQALWEAALDDLYELELVDIKGQAGEAFGVTILGYDVADQLSKAG